MSATFTEIKMNNQSLDDRLNAEISQAQAEYLRSRTVMYGAEGWSVTETRWPAVAVAAAVVAILAAVY